MMTMVGEATKVPPWSSDNPMARIGGYHLPVSGLRGCPYHLDEAALGALRSYLPCSDSSAAAGDEDELSESDTPVGAYSSDEFRMYEFKVRRCTRGRSHDWTECPYAHPGEKARRRDPRRFHYSGAACPDFRKGGGCKRGDACEFAHGVFECWLHPARYRTQPCKDGIACRRRVCFFAHTPDQLRILPQHLQPKAAVESYDGSPRRQQVAAESYFSNKIHHLISTSPTSTLPSPPLSPPSESPPVSPISAAQRRSSGPVMSSSANDILSPMRRLRLSQSMPVSWSFGSPRGTLSSCSVFGAGFGSLPSTPTTTGGVVWFDEPAAAEERVESGRGVRAKMFERLSKEFRLEKAAAAPAAPAREAVGISDLVI